MKKIIIILVVILVVFFLIKSDVDVEEVSLNKIFSDEYYSFDDINVGDRKYIDYTVTNNGVVPVKVRVKISDKWMNQTGKIIKAPDDAIIKHINYDYWEYKDGYYYYKNILEVGNTTEKLINYIELNEDLSDVNCINTDNRTSVCTGDMNGLSNMNYKISFKKNVIDYNLYDKVWKQM